MVPSKSSSGLGEQPRRSRKAQSGEAREPKGTREAPRERRQSIGEPIPLGGLFDNHSAGRSHTEKEAQPVYTLSKRFRFEASHQLPLHDGKCRRLHGHSWQGVVTLEGEKLQQEGAKSGMLIDFGDISLILNPVVERYLDHQHLNSTTGLENPTSEELARWLYLLLRPRFGRMLKSIRIEETCTSACEYKE